MEVGKEKMSDHTRQNLFSSKEAENNRKVYIKKRKTKGQNVGVTPPVPAVSTAEGPTIVPAGIVQARLSELAGTLGGGGKNSKELPKKQRVSTNAKSAAAADGSPRQAQ